jgi:hypothetical protein
MWRGRWRASRPAPPTSRSSPGTTRSECTFGLRHSRGAGSYSTIWYRAGCDWVEPRTTARTVITDQTFSCSTVRNNLVQSISWLTLTNQTGQQTPVGQFHWRVLVSWATVLNYYIRSTNWKFDLILDNRILTLCRSVLRRKLGAVSCADTYGDIHAEPDFKPNPYTFFAIWDEVTLAVH